MAACFATTFVLFSRRRVRMPRQLVGKQLRFADGTRARVYRETRLGSGLAKEPCTLVVAIHLRLVHGPAHALFCRESVLNTPLFVGFPGFTSKLWLAHDERNRYHGVYEWDGQRRAGLYARSLWRVLALVSVPGSIRYIVVPGLHRDDMIANSPPTGQAEPDDTAWWRTAVST